jgi:hypothetical protein
MLTFFNFAFQRVGFELFRAFLSGTSGAILLDFWLDCENFKDTMEDFDENKQRDIASMLYRFATIFFSVTVSTYQRPYIVQYVWSLNLLRDTSVTYFTTLCV